MTSSPFRCAQRKGTHLKQRVKKIGELKVSFTYNLNRDRFYPHGNTQAI